MMTDHVQFERALVALMEENGTDLPDKAFKQNSDGRYSIAHIDHAYVGWVARQNEVDMLKETLDDALQELESRSYDAEPE